MFANIDTLLMTKIARETNTTNKQTNTTKCTRGWQVFANIETLALPANDKDGQKETNTTNKQTKNKQTNKQTKKHINMDSNLC